MKLDLEAANVYTLNLTVTEARSMNENVVEKIEQELDEAQADVFTDRETESYLVIKIIK